MCKLWPKQMRENNTTKKNYVKASTDEGRMSIGSGYLDEDGTKLEAIDPTQEIYEEPNPKKATVLTEV